jgi:AraC-like DNA-binding protein
VLECRGLLDAPGLRLSVVRCQGEHGWSLEEQVTGASVVLVRRGVFLRRVEGTVAVADVTTGYLQRPGESQQVAHPAGGDVCTSIGVPHDVVERLAHAGPVVVSAAADLVHRRLLARAHLGTARAGLVPGRGDIAGDVARAGPSAAVAGLDSGRPGRANRVAHAAGSAAVGGPDAGPIGTVGGAWRAGQAAAVGGPDAGSSDDASGAARVDIVDLGAALIDALLPPPRPRPVSAAARSAVDEVRAALDVDPALALDDLAALAGWSPWYLSRMFRSVTGVTVGAYRRTLRVRAALDQMTDGRDGLAALAVRNGFADQAHLTRAMRREIDMPPATARRWLRGEPR